MPPWSLSLSKGRRVRSTEAKRSTEQPDRRRRRGTRPNWWLNIFVSRDFCIPPKGFEVVKSACFVMKNVDNDVEIVGKYPSACLRAFGMHGPGVKFFADAAINVVGHGANLCV